MLKNYFLVAIRNLYRNKYYALINIVGLGIAMALCVVGYVNYRFSQSFNSGHRDADHIYALASYTQRDGRRQDIIQHPTPLAPAIAADVPGVINHCRLAVDVGDVRSGNMVFEETLWYVDPGFFDMFTFDFRQGALGSFGSNPSGVIITENIAKKLLGDSVAVGRQLSITMLNRKIVDFAVLAVIAEPPVNSSFSDGVYITYSRLTDIYDYNIESWTDWTSASFLMFDDHRTMQQVSTSLGNYVAHTNEANPNDGRDGFYLTPMRDFAALTQDIGGPLRGGMHPAAIMAPSVVAFLILLLACFNFMNTSIAFAARRVREIGVRKVIGSMRGQLVWQFLGENLLLCLFSLILAAALAEVLVPAYGSLWPDLDLSFSYTDSPGLIGFLLGMLLFTGVAAGLYPALYVSRFSPTAIFRGRQKLGGTNTLIRVLLTLQLALSMTSIVAAAILTRNAAYIRDFGYGYEVKNTLVIPLDNPGQYDVIRIAAANNADVVSVGATQNLMNSSWGAFPISIDGRDVTVNSYKVGEYFFETLHFNLIQGRFFDSSLATDRTQAVIVNKTLVNEAGWDNPLEKTVVLNINDVPKDYRVVGVVGDFYPNAINSRIRPAIIRMAAPEQYQFAVIRIRPGSRQTVNAYFENQWSRNYPSLAYKGYWQDRFMQRAYDVNDNIRLVFLYVAAIAIVISSMGLLALVSLNIARRTHEIGIRKALGASAANISALVTREFVILVLIGSVLAVGLGYYLTDMLLSSMWTYYCDFGVAPFVLSILVIVGVAGLSVGYRVVSAARANPVDALKYE